MPKGKSHKLFYFVSAIILLLISVASFSFYNLLNVLSVDLLAMFGVENPYLQNIIIILIVFLLLLITGYGFKKAIEKITGHKLLK